MPLPVLLVHGAWHGGWSWSALQHELDRRGVGSYAPDLPGRALSLIPPAGLSGDVGAVAAMLDRLGGRVVLVGHSYGGAVVGQVAGQHPAVAAAVFVCAFALEPGESVNGFLRAAPRHRVALAECMLSQPDGSIELDRARLASIYGDLPAPELAAHAARLSRQPPDTFTVPVTSAPFGRVPTTYVLCEDDQAVHPAHQELMAARCDRVVRLRGGHFPMLHAPDVLAELLASIAAEREP